MGDSSSSSQQVRIAVDYHCIPKHRSRHSGTFSRYANDFECGEDAVAFSGNDRFAFLAVNDGVGGYKKSGGSPILASQIGTNMDKLGYSLSEKSFQEPLNFIYRAYQDAVPLEYQLSGATTSVLGVIDTDNLLLKTVTLGDSGILVIRDGLVVFETDKLVISHNRPVALEYNSAHSKEHNLRDTHNLLHDAAQQEFQLNSGDVIVAASDGLLDNLYPTEIAQFIHALGPKFSPEDISKFLANKAHLYSLGIGVPSPRPLYSDFQKGFMSRYSCEEHAKTVYKKCYGDPPLKTRGKEDDISVVVAIIN